MANIKHLTPKIATFGLVLLSIILVAWQHWGMNSRLVINPSSNLTSWVEDDRQKDGASIATLEKAETYHMHCSLKSNSHSPYCNLFIQLLNDEKHIDLSIYKTVKITLNYNSNLRDSIRINLNYFYPPQKPLASGVYYKPNQQSINPSPGLHTYTLKLSEFYVASWWVYWNNVTQEEMNPDLSSVMDLVITTGENTNSHEVDIEFVRAEFEGKWIEPEALYRYILIFWVCLIISYSIRRVYLLRVEIALQKKQTQVLKSHNEQLNVRSKHLEELAKHDELTGVYNVEGIRDFFLASTKNKKKTRQPISIILLEPDNLHRLNNLYSVDQTDKLLKNLAALLTQQCPPTHAVARWSHAEFLIVCPNNNIDAANQLAKHLCKTVRETKLVEGHVITCSLGVAEVRNDSITESLHNAETALARAKQTGRNRSMSAN